MTFAAMAPLHTVFALDPGRDDAVGMALSATLPLAAVVILSGFIPMDAWPTLPFALPAWGQQLAVLMLFPILGAARWVTASEGAEGRAASHWVVALIVWMIGYPLAAGWLDPFFLGWLNLATFLLAVGTAARVAGVSGTGLAWMMPAVVLLGLGAIEGYVLLTSGWSPGFAVTAVAYAHPRD